MNGLLLSLNQASKDYAGQAVLRDITLSIHKGETLAIAGQNGSGKSTLLKMTGGLIGLSRGERIVHAQDGNVAIGYMPDRFPKIRMTGWAYLKHMGAISGIPRQQLQTRMAELLEQLGMGLGAVNRPCRQYSKGMLQKINMIQAILKPPDLLLLDEPLSGLDAQSQEAMMRMLQSLKQGGMAIVLTSHEPKIVAGLADTIKMIANGRLMPEQKWIRNIQPAKRVGFTLPPDVDGKSWAARQGVQVEPASANRWICRVGAAHSDSLLKAILDSGGHIESVTTDPTPKLPQVIASDQAGGNSE